LTFDLQPGGDSDVAAFLIVVAAGAGSRLGRPEPKALVPLLGRPLLSWTLEALSEVPFAGTVIAAPPDRLDEVRRIVEEGKVVPGGATRAESVRLAFEAGGVAGENVIVVHDAARPFVTPREVEAVILAAEEVGAAIATTPVPDTVKSVERGRVTGTLDRSKLWLAGTPQAFRGHILARTIETGREATDEAFLCEELGFPVAAVPVSRLGFKITTPEDLEMAEAILWRRAEGGRS
jgi:2-C-methyl-D-erythritol 4-phosphate cytidylyltransferase